MGLFSRKVPRREQIVAQTLELLARAPLERLTTRDIAAAVGVTQPAIFRHFRTREAIFLAVVAGVRSELEAALEALLASPRPPLDLCVALADMLAAQIERHPGLPRLLFADFALDAPELGRAVRHLVSMQRTLVTELVRQARERGEVRADVDPAAAATLFVGMVQAHVLVPEAGAPGAHGGPGQSGFGDRPALELEAAPARPLQERLRPVRDLWVAALTGIVGAVAVAQPLHRPKPVGVGPRRVLALDVRPILARGVDPLAHILAAVEELPPGSALVITAPFRPRPLERLLAGRGHGVSTHPGPGGTFNVVCAVGGAEVLDLRELEPPEPLERVMTAAAQLPAGGSLLAHVPRAPRWLFPHLDARGLRRDLAELADESAILLVEAPGP